uniref:Uncharacterized protein n=1 Tax=Euplotes harpa TaxID=151035 RepID=A0A7S3J4N1_9SPIT|mmetsp:Transcript_1669/g.2078  ORF Transcript_1669/g.2078 Transcript_1669/m.2078 type:complete len:203 (+) Transcript_1669:2620-3228(+)
MEEVKHKTKKADLFKSISMERVDHELEGINSSVYKVTDEILESKTVVNIMYMHISPFIIRVNYKSDNLNLINLCKGDLLNYMTNMVDISNLKVKIREFKISDKIVLDKGISKLIDFYLNDLIYNQKLNLLASVYPIRVTINIMKAFATLVKTPYNSYVNQKYITVGIYQGFSEFLTKISHEFGDVGSKVMNYLNSWKNFKSA